MAIILDKTTALSELAFVVDSTNTIELILKRILTKYLCLTGARGDFFSRIFLHNSVVGLGQKFRVLHHIVATEGWPTLDAKHFHNVLSIRNSFAHSDTDTFTVQVTISGDGNHTTGEPYQVVDSLKSSGKYELLKRSDALSRFTESLSAVQEYLRRLDADYVWKVAQQPAGADAGDSAAKP